MNQAQNAFVTGAAPGGAATPIPNIVPYETFATADGEIAVAVGSDRQWPRFCEALGLPALAADPRFATNGDRVEHRDELRPILADGSRDVPPGLVAALRRGGDPVRPVNDILAAFASPRRPRSA